MKVNREMIVRAALHLLDEIGLEALTLRKLASALGIQAPTLYWHFKSKDALIDEMATLVLIEGVVDLVLTRGEDGWEERIARFGHGLRKTLLRYRDGGRMVAGTRLTNTTFQQTAEQVGSQLVAAGFSPRQAIVLMSAVYTFTVSFVIEEQAVFPVPGQRSPAYDIKQRNAGLDARTFPLLRRAGTVLFDQFDRRYRESLALMVRGAAAELA
jgi:AcrR family transcriptional regulator